MRQTVHSATLPVGGRSGNGTLVSRCHSRSAEAPAGRLQNSLRMTEPLAPFLEVRPEGLYCPAFDAAIDPPVAARRAIVSHAHSDHAAPGHQEVWGTPETIAVYRRRNPDWTGEAREASYGERLRHPRGELRREVRTPRSDRRALSRGPRAWLRTDLLRARRAIAPVHRRLQETA